MEQFRGWTIAALYGVLGVISLLILYTCYQLSNNIAEIPMILIGLAFLSFTSAILNLRAMLLFFKHLKESRDIPKLDLWPFLTISITLIIAIRLFSGI
ncbi:MULTISPECIES: hypothetical protein [Kordiimonas]|uniref:hypothetical protein n=1 Tax=Kordiimonas TaxID=288021 RepID=UPI001FF15DDB|nr:MULTISPECIES: hypothetical protein [Kordiimonas]MCK0068387.1 hypothetical protein [Kordiimonas laminariae]UTW59625.1 hypothetical protein KFE96_04790 [Kordiimonas sp. SCSIO 12603]